VLTANQSTVPDLLRRNRPFFLEGTDAFQTPINLIHTRTIVAPDAAVKLTGKHGRSTIGALFATDDAAKARLPAQTGRGTGIDGGRDRDDD
jgi:hypothetical protein